MISNSLDINFIYDGIRGWLCKNIQLELNIAN